MTSPYLDQPLRSVAEVLAARKARFRYYATGNLYGDCETVNEWAETPEIAARQIRDRAGLENFERWEVDPVPDCALLPDGTFVRLDRAIGRRIALAQASAA